MKETAQIVLIFPFYFGDGWPRLPLLPTSLPPSLQMGVPSRREGVRRTFLAQI